LIHPQVSGYHMTGVDQVIYFFVSRCCTRSHFVSADVWSYWNTTPL